MAFDQATRNRLSKFVSDTRKLLSDEFAQQLRVKYGLDPATGVVTDIDKLPTMAEGDRQTAQMLRDTLEHYLATAPKRDKKTIATMIDRIVREQAFTVLNRLCAVRMAESRDLVIESIAQGTKSKGFQLYARLAGSALGETGDAYVCYLFSLCDELSIDLPVLFDRFSPSGRLFPRESVLIDVLGQINHHELQHLWAEDETIGWIYQYFNSDEERKAMRDVKAGGSAAPRNSRELAVRNQFFTPRYVVEFLTDNTLGRIWYEMTQGRTCLVDNCKYLVRRTDEVFLSHMTSKDQEHPSDDTIAMAELLLSGTEETFPEFKADDPQPMIELAHCVSAYATMGDRAHEILGNETLMVRERSVREPSEITDAVEAAPYVFAGHLETIATQHILEVLFMTCRSDRHGGDGSVYSEPWFVDACNEVRRRVLYSRRDDLSQDELLRQPVFIPYRLMKDPRDIKMIDPACGSMHFGLYAFDLFLTIYEEAWELEEQHGGQAFMRPRELKSLRDCYGTRDRYMLDVPRLIIERNIHGIDIDSRAVQIAALSLWLRAQKAWHDAGVKSVGRLQITRSNIVCAEPMPGEADLLEQFITEHLSQTSEQQTIASIVRHVFEAMKLAGEAGSLLKIEEEIADTIAEAKKKWIEGPQAVQLPLFAVDLKQKDTGLRPLLVAGIDDASFWDQIEELIYSALKTYAEKATPNVGFQRRLFAQDAARGFAFIDICRNVYDVALMNPPFGDASLPSKPYIEDTYGDTKGDVYKAFVECFQARLVPAGYLGIISSRTGFFLSQSEDWRIRVVLRLFRPIVLADLGSGVLDAMVEVAAYVLRSLSAAEARDLSLSIVPVLEKVVCDSQGRFSLPKWQAARGGLKRHQAVEELKQLEAQSFIQRSAGNIVRYSPLWHSVKKITAPTEPVYAPFVCVRVLAEDDKGAALSTWNSGVELDRTFVCEPASFEAVPGSPFSYWVTSKFRHTFALLPPLEQYGQTAKQGTVTADDFRFVRIWWEVPPSELSDAGDHPPESQGAYCLVAKKWIPFAKGGICSPYYLDMHLVLNWGHDGIEVRTFANPLTGKTYSRPQNTDWFFKPGITWSARTTSAFSARVMPRGCSFSHKGPGVFVEEKTPIRIRMLLALMNSRVFRECIALQLSAADAAARSYEVGIIQRTPIPVVTDAQAASFAGWANEAWSFKFALGTYDLVSHAFTIPPLVSETGSTLAQRAAAWASRVHASDEHVAAVQAEIDILAYQVYGLATAGFAALTYTTATEATADVDSDTREDEEEDAATADVTVLAADLLSYGVGVALGRWDIRYATGEQVVQELPDPFATLPVCPPGQLQSTECLPARPEDVPAAYPVRIPWDGILVDDPNHQLDIERRVREVMEIIWNGKDGDSTAESIEHEACEILGVKSLRDYFRKPTGFFTDQLKRYSKSRRQAPIYWPLSTNSGNYTLWLYYHRLTDQTLYTAVNDFVEPKQKQVNDDLKSIETRTDRTKADEAELERLSVLSTELEDFRKELRRIADLWKPNRNDGVQITAAPLWKFFQFKKWRDTLKKTWEDLEEGKFDWAHLALSIWPERVVRSAYKDRNIAIAHELEGLLWHEVEVRKTSKTGRVTTKIEWQPRELSEKELDAIVAKVKSGELGTDRAAPSEVANG